MPDPHSAVAANLCGYVAVDISSEEAKRRFEQALRCLYACGWKMDGGSGHIDLVPARSADLRALQGATIIRCETDEQAKRFKAIPADPFAILTRLGGGAMERILAESVADGPIVDRVTIGLNWTMVRAGKLCGIARSPARGTEGARTIRPEDGFVGKSLRHVAGYLCSIDALRRSLGLAAVNAWWNRPELLQETKRCIRKTGGFSAVTPPGDGVVIVGGFRGAARRLPAARIVEREPRPGDIPVAEAPKAFAQAKRLLITAQTLMNASLEPILNASRMVPHRTLVGPSAPLCPRIFPMGLDEISGLAVIDPEATERFIIETGTMIMLEHLMTAYYLHPPDASGEISDPAPG